MAVLLPGKVLYLAHPRTASTSMRDALLSRGAVQILPHHIGLHSPEVQALYRGEPVITVIRNPYDLLVSWWLVRTLNRRASQPKLASFINSFRDGKGNFVRDGKLLYHRGDADIEIRYENFDEELDTAWKKLGVEDVSLGKVNQTHGKDKPWQSYYNYEAFDAANRRFGSEIVDAGYDMLT